MITGRLDTNRAEGRRAPARVAGAHRLIEGLRGNAPLLVLGLICVASLAGRSAWLGNPSRLVFDERYYVNAARVILGTPVPTGDAYVGASPGLDPNLEHPPLGKLAIAAGMKVFGDNPLGWRSASLVFGTAAIVGMYWLARAAGGSAWLGVGAAVLMAVENLFVVHGRIATLDIFVVALMLPAVALYIRGRPVLAGLVLGIAACTKVVAVYGLVILALFELLRVTLPPPAGEDAAPAGASTRLRSLAICAIAAAMAYAGLLFVLDLRFTTFADPVSHTRYMLGFAANLPAHPGTFRGVRFAPTSSPWQWLLNREPILYYQQVTPPGGPLRALVLFQGRMNPFVIYLAIPTLAVALRESWRRRDPLAQLAVAWTVGTFLAFVVVSLGRRFNYIYYMTVVLPGVFLLIARFFSGKPRAAILAYGCALAFGTWALFPFRTWGGA